MELHVWLHQPGLYTTATCLSDDTHTHTPASILIHPRALSAGRDCATAFKSLMELIHQIVLKPSADRKAKLPAFSKDVANGVGEVVHVAEILKGLFSAGTSVGVARCVNVHVCKHKRCCC